LVFGIITTLFGSLVVEGPSLFHKYFHVDNGGSHQTGWTGLVAKFIHLYGMLNVKQQLDGGKMAGFKVDFELKDADPANVGSGI
jgi:hypothetical protein